MDDPICKAEIETDIENKCMGASQFLNAYLLQHQSWNSSHSTPCQHVPKWLIHSQHTLCQPSLLEDQTKHREKDTELPLTMYKAPYLSHFNFFLNVYAWLKVLCILPWWSLRMRAMKLDDSILSIIKKYFNRPEVK